MRALRLIAPLLVAPVLTVPLSGQNPATPTADGMGAQLALDASGTVRLAYGKRDTVFVMTSTDQGRSFSPPVLVGVVPRMYLGNTSGPVIASGKSRSLVGAIDRAGNIFLFQLDHGSGKWTRAARPLNDVPGAVPEGLMTLAADHADGFHAVWLDQRVRDRTEMFYARIPGLSQTAPAIPNVRIYASRSGSVCECCKPSIDVAGKNVAITFRNSLDGNRDMYLLRSDDGGTTFGTAAKLGQGSWRIDACPVDGGAVGIDATGKIVTVWRRDSTIYTAEAGAAEERLAEGRSPSLSVSAKGPAFIWQEGAKIFLRRPGAKLAAAIGEGRLPQLQVLSDGKLLATWEQSGKIYVRRLE